MRHQWFWVALGCCAAGAVHAQAGADPGGVVVALNDAGAAPAASHRPVQQAERLLVDITAWRRHAPKADALSLIRQREPEAPRERTLQPSGGLSTEFKAIGMELDHGARLLFRGRKLTYRSQF